MTSSSSLTGKQLIGWEEVGGGTEPTNGFYEATAPEVDRAASLSRSAFELYRKTSGSEKAALLLAIAGELSAIAAELLPICSAETNLPLARLEGELGRTLFQLRLFAEVLQEGSWVDARIEIANPDRSPVPKPDHRSMQIALGPVAVFGASNFPLAFSVAGGDTVSALAAGCTVIYKANPAHPGTSELVAKAVIRAVRARHLPEGVFSMLHGGPATGAALVTHPAIKAVGFTGSFKAGSAIVKAAANRPEPIPVYAEMGSANPVFVLPGALQRDASRIAAGYVQSLTLGAGQFCTNPGLLVVSDADPEVEHAFSATLREAVGQASVHPMLTPAIRSAFQAGITERRSHPALEVLTSATPAEGRPAPILFATGYQQFIEHPALEEELFGPAGIVITAPHKTALLDIARHLSGHLTATVHATEEELSDYHELFDILEQKVGRILINGFPTGVEVSHAMVHGGPYPATSDSRSTSVGTAAIHRFTRAVCYQSFPDSLLPDELKKDNPLHISRIVNGTRGLS